MNKYPKAKKCPSCGCKMDDGETCYRSKCYRLFGAVQNTEKKQFVPKCGDSTANNGKRI